MDAFSSRLVALHLERVAQAQVRMVESMIIGGTQAKTINVRTTLVRTE
jgi:hypothetical protein